MLRYPPRSLDRCDTSLFPACTSADYCIVPNDRVARFVEGGEVKFQQIWGAAEEFISLNRGDSFADTRTRTMMLNMS